MRVNARNHDERGSALVAVIVVMLVVTMFALTLASVVTNTSRTLAGGRDTAQARAAAEAGLAAGRAAFRKAEACVPAFRSQPSQADLKYEVTCVADSREATFTSTGSGNNGARVSVQAVYAYTTAQAYEAKVGQLTFFSGTATYSSNIVTSSTSDRAKVVIAGGDFYCKTAMAADVVVDGDFYAYTGCAVSGWVKARGTTRMYGGSSVGKDLTSGGSATLFAVSSVGGSLTCGGYAQLDTNSSVGGDLSTGGYAKLASGTSVRGNVTSIDYGDVDGTVKGNLASGAKVNTWYNSDIAGSVTAAGSDRTQIRGKVGKGVMAAGPVTIDYNGVVTGNVASAGTGLTSVYGTVSGNLTAAGAVYLHNDKTIDGDVTAAGTDPTVVNGTITGILKAAGTVTVNGTVSKDVTAAGSGLTSVYGTVTGSLKAAGAVYLHNNRTISGDVIAAGTNLTSVNGTIAGSLKVGGAVTVNGTVSRDVTAAGTGLTSVNGTVNGSLKVAGTVMINYNRPVGGDVTTSGTGKDTIYGQISGNLNAGGDVNIPGGSVGGNLTLPASNALTPDNAPSRVAGTVTRKAGPPAPDPPNSPSAPAAPSSPAAVKVSAPSSPTIPTWQDYGYASTDWPGYTPQVLKKSSSWCSARNWATYLGTFTVPTVLDATACRGGLNAHPKSSTAVTIGVNVVVVSSRIDLQYATFEAAKGITPNLWFIVPSTRQSVKGYAGTTSGSGEIDLDSSNLGVATILYTPNRINYHTSTFTGSMYAGGIVFDGGTPGDIKAAPVEFPIALFDPTQSPTTPSGTFSMNRVSQREVR